MSRGLKNSKTPGDRGSVTKDWERFAKEFDFDGSFRDIYVFGTSPGDWAELFRFLVRKRYTVEFSGAWSGTGFPGELARLFPSGPDSQATLMSIRFSGLLVNCHFFQMQEIEFDIDPREVTEATRLAELFAFMGGLADTLGKIVVLTPENMPEHVIFRCRPGAEHIDYVPEEG